MFTYYSRFVLLKSVQRIILRNIATKFLSHTHAIYKISTTAIIEKKYKVMGDILTILLSCIKANIASELSEIF